MLVTFSTTSSINYCPLIKRRCSIHPSKSMLYAFLQQVKDIIIITFEAHNRNNYLLSINLLQVGLGEHANTMWILWLGEDDSITAKAHWSGFETIAIDTNGLFPIQSSLIAVPKAKVGKCKCSLVSNTYYHTEISQHARSAKYAGNVILSSQY